jgi:SUF system NifU family Fe-S assembly protein
MELDDLYQQIILDHNKKRAGYGLQPGGCPSHQYNPTCGDELTLTVRLSEDGSTITAFEWEGKGCSISQASASLMTSEATGMSVAEFETFAEGFRDAIRAHIEGDLPRALAEVHQAHYAGRCELVRFRADPASRGKVLDTGLWRYSRHPNYFGNAVMWWGLGLFGVAVGAWPALVGPLVMTVLLLKVSGVALLERDIGQRRPDYARYIRRTSAFVPWFPKADA